ncbi:MAG: hypothetical protein GQ477_05485 [Nanohaloarchaea archaeon]|nr:hypothetical protein [Candidatus Nanohaloarchaea archaeon]
MDDIIKTLTAEELHLAENAMPYLSKVISDCLKVKKDETLLIMGDSGYEDRRLSIILCVGYFLAAKKLGLNIPKIIIQTPKVRGDYADPSITDTLKNLNQNTPVIVAISNRLGKFASLSKSFRTFIKHEGHRFASMPSLGKIPTRDIDKVLTTLDIDYDAVRKNCEIIRKIIDDGKELHITTDEGTDLYMNIHGKKALSVTGVYDQAGTGGNMPIGEVYTPCRGKFVNGTVVVDLSSQTKDGTQLITTPITLEIKEGNVISITGDKEAENLKETIEWAHDNSKFPWGVRRIGELGIGLNPNAKIIGSMNIDEKVMGTAHVAIGSNYWFGGTIYAIVHLDQVFKNPKIKVDGKLLELPKIKQL